MNGHGVTKDLVKAKEWLEKAISNGPPARVYDLARICEDSDPAVRDLARADALHRRLADGGYMLSQNRMAWWLSTAADPGLRDGKEAVRYALMSVAQKRIAGTVDTLAAAYARDGQFEKAVEAQREAIELLGKSADPDTVADYLTRLRLYEAGTPYTGPTLQVEPGKPEVRG
jgi:TPR repeat protein